ncbi:xanthine dehydrogenase small subunit [Parahalioglobus pacificus]|uniref:Xanthine dehydrogenase small subunit n=1 Tax=Parahalioglobus pacificus TaxID=930806 RepID=A0A919CI90_9GAMM|nr:xanthine dehydrogenase small subunit [Halioglobus pacificus]GHD25563.1 xanthine dehydrogenase small subunit [Halioglobus pacificus]
MISFLLDGTEHRLEQLDPNTTVLDYLRENLGLTGTKEGCASGDCGACTVVVTYPQGDALSYLAINACITLLATLDGCQLLTVESLARDGQLHRVQQAMVDCHASQCGFCTPGFVMSMFAYRKSNRHFNAHAIETALGGNLCRCTGYRPIVDAAVKMYEPDASDSFSKGTLATLRALEGLRAEPSTPSCAADGRNFLAPSSASALADALAANPGARLIAGGTDLALEITQQLKQFSTLISTARAPELQKVEQSADTLSIGAAVTYEDCAEILCTHWPDLDELLRRLGAQQIRNRGTLGGNIGNASPIGDFPPVLIALDARVELQSKTGRRQVAMADFFTGYRQTALGAGEFIRTIHIPLPHSDDWFQVYKVSKRLEDDISAVCGAFRLRYRAGTVEDVGIAYGGMAAVPQRATQTEAALRGRPLSQAAITDAMNALDRDFTPIEDFRASADYRQRVARNLLQRLLLVHQQGDGRQLRVSQYRAGSPHA